MKVLNVFKLCDRRLLWSILMLTFGMSDPNALGIRDVRRAAMRGRVESSTGPAVGLVVGSLRMPHCVIHQAGAVQLVFLPLPVTCWGRARVESATLRGGVTVGHTPSAVGPCTRYVSYFVGHRPLDAACRCHHATPSAASREEGTDTCTMPLRCVEGGGNSPQEYVGSLQAGS